MAAGKLPCLRALSTALEHWTDSGNPSPVGRWLVSELDSEGVPRRLPVADWFEVLRLLNLACQERSNEWPVEFDAMITGLLLATLRFCRPGGSAMFQNPAESEDRRDVFQSLAQRTGDSSIMTVLDWWFPSRGSSVRHAPPPLPAQARSDRVLAVLRSNWSNQGDFAALDHRAASFTTTFELNGLGRPWLGPSWTLDSTSDAPGRARPLTWVSQSSADFHEWTFKIGKGRLTRSVVVLRGRRIALLSELWEGSDDPGALRIQVPEDVKATELTECRGLALVSERPRKSIRVYPIGLPKAPRATDRGSLTMGEGELIFRQATTGRRTFRTLLVSWEPLRHRQNIDWRGLTITEEGKSIGPDQAFATRVRWGRDDTLLIYRNHGKPATRAFLGHQTRARFLVGLFSKEGTVQPLLKVESENESKPPA